MREIKDMNINDDAFENVKHFSAMKNYSLQFLFLKGDKSVCWNKRGRRQWGYYGKKDESDEKKGKLTIEISTHLVGI